MPNLNEEVRIRTTVDNTQADKGLSDLPIKVRKASQNVEKEFTNAGRRAGDAFARETESRINKSMRFIGQNFSRYFGELGRTFGEIFQIGKDVNEILPKRGGRGGGGGVVVADIASDVGQMAQQAVGQRNIVGKFDENKSFFQQALKNQKNGGAGGFVSAATNGAAGGAAAGGIAGALPGLGIGLAVGAVIGGVGYLVTKMVEAKKETAEFAKQLGVSKDMAEQLMTAGNATGNLDAFGDSVLRITKLLDDARKGSIAARKELEKIGVKNVFGSNEQAISDVFDKIQGMSSQKDRDKATVKAGFTVEQMNAEAIRRAEAEVKSIGNNGAVDPENYTNATEFTNDLKRLNEAKGKLDSLKNVDPSTLRNRQNVAQIQVNKEKALTDVDPEKTKEAEAVTKAIQQQVEAAKELAEVGKEEVEQSQDKIRDLERSISLAEIELGHANGVAEAEAKKAEIAKLNVSLAEQKVNLEKQQLELTNKRTNLENSIVENRLKLAEDGKLSMSELAGTNSPAGREAKAIGGLEDNYKNALASGNTAAAEQIKSQIDKRKLGLVQSGILSPDALQYEEHDANGFLTQRGFNKADVLAGMASNGKKMTAAELLKTQGLRGEQLARGNVAGVANQSEFIRGVRTSEYKNEIKGNAATLLEVMNRNGGALPVRALIQ